MSKDNDFCRRLISLRKEAGITQSQLEIQADLPMMCVVHYETGTRRPGLENIKKLCRGLGCTATDLLGI